MGSLGGADAVMEEGGQVISALPANARTRWHVDRLVTEHITVDGRATAYAVGGRGLPVLFLHGWGLDHRAYQRSLRRLTTRGCRVIAPSMPGFGGTAPLPAEERTLEGYAAWVGRFVDAIGEREPLIVLGHSFGGGVATKFAHECADRVRYLVMLNSVGDPRVFVGNLLSKLADVRTQSVVDPLLHLWLPTATGKTARLIPRVFIDNLLRDVRAVADAARVAMTADLSVEMAQLAERGLPTLVLWSDSDGVIPLSAFDTFCATFGAAGQVVTGGHSWLLASPDVFGQVLDNVLHVQATQDRESSVVANTSQLRALLSETTLPARTIDRLLDGVSPLWVLSAPPSDLAADIAMCHPRLRRDEVRVAARKIRSSDLHRLTVVARDRAGLLADTTAVLARERVSVVSASAMTSPGSRLAMHSITVRVDGVVDRDRWNEIGDRLRRVAAGEPVSAPYVASGRADVTVTGEGDGRSVVRVTAADRIGLLSAVCRWFADHDVSVEAASVSTLEGIAKDVFLVDGTCDVDALVRALSGRGRCPMRSLARVVCPSTA